jgi:hypothetical protein
LPPGLCNDGLQNPTWLSMWEWGQLQHVSFVLKFLEKLNQWVDSPFFTKSTNLHPPLTFNQGWGNGGWALAGVKMALMQPWWLQVQ